MVEILVRVKDRSDRPDDSKAGDVIAACPVGWEWTKRERTNPNWRIITADLLPTEISALTSPVCYASGKIEHKRKYGINLAGLSSRPDRPELLAAMVMRKSKPREMPGVEYAALVAAGAMAKVSRSTSRRNWLRGVVCGIVLLFAAKRAKAATTVVKSIGTTGRDYSTLQAWEDDCPASLTAVDQIWQGECYNDSEFTAAVTISGVTVDATRYVVLKCAAGQSFQDHADVRTNPLRYDQSKGVGIKCTTSYATIVYANQAYTRVLGLQIDDGGAGNGVGLRLNTTGCIGKDCLLSKIGANATPLLYLNGGGMAVNCVVTPGGGLAVFMNDSGCKTLGCTLVTPSDITPNGTNGYAFQGNYHSNSVVQSCAIFNFTGVASGGGSFDTTNSKYNATNLASGLPGTTGNQHSVSWSQTTPFVDADKDSLDLRAIAATALEAGGFLDSTNAPNDISKTARAASPTIGAWELATSAAKRRMM
jgi:hypothetical protein